MFCHFFITIFWLVFFSFSCLGFILLFSFIYTRIKVFKIHNYYLFVQIRKFYQGILNCFFLQGPDRTCDMKQWHPAKLWIGRMWHPCQEPTTPSMNSKLWLQFLQFLIAKVISQRMSSGENIIISCTLGDSQSETVR